MKPRKADKGLPVPAKPDALQVHVRKAKADHAPFVVVRTEKRSWLVIAITGFGALLLRYMRTVREKGRILRLRK